MHLRRKHWGQGSDGLNYPIYSVHGNWHPPDKSVLSNMAPRRMRLFEEWLAGELDQHWTSWLEAYSTWLLTWVRKQRRVYKGPPGDVTQPLWSSSICSSIRITGVRLRLRTGQGLVRRRRSSSCSELLIFRRSYLGGWGLAHGDCCDCVSYSRSKRLNNWTKKRKWV